MKTQSASTEHRDGDALSNRHLQPTASGAIMIRRSRRAVRLRSRNADDRASARPRHSLGEGEGEAETPDVGRRPAEIATMMTIFNKSDPTLERIAAGRTDLVFDHLDKGNAATTRDSYFTKVLQTRTILLAFAAVVASCERTGGPVFPESGAGKDEKLLAELQQTLAKAWVGGDRATIERIIAPDWSSTGPDGRITNRAGVLADVFETRLHKIHRVEIDDVRVRVFGDAAVVTGRTHGVGEVEGATYDVFIRFTDTFVRREGRWHAVVSHASLLAGRQ